MKRRRGSALVFVVIVVFSITAVVLVTAKLSSASATEYTNRLQEAQFKSMADGAISQAKSDAYLGTLATGTRTATYTNGTVSAVVAAHPTIARAYQVTISGTIGDRPFSETKLLGNRAKPNPAHYALWVKDNYSDSLLATTINGSAYFVGNATLSGAWSISDDFLVRGSSTLSLGTTVGGHFLTGVREQTMPDFVKANYTSGTSLGNTMANITFGGESGGYYASMNKATGNLSLSGGTISGRGTIYVDGNLNINGNYNYANASSRVVFLVKGRITFGALATQAVGTFYAKDTIAVSGVTLTIPRGNICGTKSFERLLAAINVTQEMDLLDRDECVKHRLPGYYP